MEHIPTTEHDTGPSAGPPPEARFAELFRSGYPLLWGIAMGMAGNETDAEDVVQESVLIGLRKFSGFTPGTSFNAWMAAIVRNVAKNHLRKRNRHRHQPQQDYPGAQPSPRGEPIQHATRGEVDADRQDFDDRLLAALQTLTPVGRACLLLRTLHELDYEAIGELMEIPKNTELSHVHRSRQALRDLLTDPDTPTGQAIASTENDRGSP